MNAPAQNIVADPNPWARWQAALNGERLDLGARGDPPQGFYRFPLKDGRQEAVAIWRDEFGELQCLRNVFGDGSNMSALQIDEMFASEHYAIPQALFLAVTENGEPWPPIYQTRLRTKDISAGLVWTEAYARGLLAANVEAFDEQGNPRAVIGDNGPPADLSPHEALAARIDALGKALAGFLAQIGGAPRTKAEADAVANYASTFKDKANEATAAHKVEKQPHLDAGREVDARWFAVRDKAEACRKKALAIADAWITAEKYRLAEEARKANEAARKVAEANAKISGEPVAPVQEVVAAPVKLGTGRTISQRSRKIAVITDLKAFVLYLIDRAEPNADIVAAAEMIAQRMVHAGVAAPGIEKAEKVSSQ